MPYNDIEKKKAQHKKYMREVWYPKNRVKHIGYQTAIKKRISAYVRDFKKGSKCIDCGFLGNMFPDVLDFDHVRDLKKFNISEFKRHTNSFKRVKEEIGKCEVVCANCHRVRTTNRKRKMSM